MVGNRGQDAAGRLPVRCPTCGQLFGIVAGDELILWHNRRVVGVAVAGVRWAKCRCGTLLKLR